MANNLNKNKNVKTNGLLKRMSNRARRLGSRVRNMGARLTNRMRSRKNTNRNSGNSSRKPNRSSNKRPNNRRSNNGSNRRPNNRRPSNGRTSNRRSNNGSNRRPNNRRNQRRNMRGGVIEYSPLPCDANGNTHWDSTLQVGHETCVEYGTHGAENDIRSAGLGADLSKKGITETIQDAVDQQLKTLMGNLDGQSAAAVRQAMQERATSLGGSTGNTAQVQGAMDPEVSRQAYQIALERQAAQAAADTATQPATQPV